MSINTGNGATAVFSVSAYAGNIVSADMTEQAMPAVDTSYLGTSGFETYIPGDLATPGTVVMEVQIDAEQAAPTTGEIETLTVTLPQGTGETAPATWAGTGFITGFKPNNFANNELQMGTLTFSWDGLTGPAFTPATTA